MYVGRDRHGSQLQPACLRYSSGPFFRWRILNERRTRHPRGWLLLGTQDLIRRLDGVISTRVGPPIHKTGERCDVPNQRPPITDVKACEGPPCTLLICRSNTRPRAQMVQYGNLRESSEAGRAPATGAGGTKAARLSNQTLCAVTCSRFYLIAGFQSETRPSFPLRVFTSLKG